MANLAGAFTSLTLLLAFALLVSSQDCNYVVHLKTGDEDGAGTDARVELKLYDAQGHKVEIHNLWNHGIMESGHDYFERNTLDFFSFKNSTCVDVCKIELGQNNAGLQSGWYVSYLKVTTHYFDGHCTRNTFQLNQWLAVDEPPYSLNLKRDLCGNSIDQFNNTEPLLQLPVST
ncbi:PLAT domain-containing protein 3-like [Silene latifolia]|uniref:PLAT domain-containing protein 3-like n=1 Tax=Silene latifolia TaxID=37657 RepID=UPI003D77A456